LLDRRPEETCLDLLKENNIGVLARGSVAQGLLINKPAKQYLGYTSEEVALAAEAIRSVRNNERGETQAAIGFVLQHPAVASAVAGIRTMEQLEEAVKTISSQRLSEKEMQTLRVAIPFNYYTDHR
jgi:aryl-alcohol dehydrogenase-like predicted oxidoreductase